jgi:hypothetical protein
MHTPGPWILDEGTGVVYGHGKKPVETGGEGCSKETQANARLIAAAPELLNLMKKHLQESGCDGDLCSRSWHEEFRAAIRKAEEED